ncbi:MAG: UDP-N-acetylglucosamine-N-acetylmuramylpentapeptide N-acetylglucosamine transferase [Actinomycetia bacterium]|nr:UDP-N-acetylglucosamine-N-acetylmuramylpentapeptide N-acetylglucosamine transferase [Actinomycetes bacterium]
MTESSPRVFALITGGGTGGHVYPALALAQALVARGHAPEELQFVGARRGLEATVVPEAGFAIELLPGRGLQRRISWENVRTARDTAAAVNQAVRIVRRLRPRVVVGVGGYASFPCILAARLLRVPIVVHEQNAAPGVVNRLAARLGARVAVSLPGTPLPDAVVTGNPIRAEIAAVERVPELAPRALFVAIGGSLGARTINDTALGLYERWRHRTDIAIHHVCGPRNLDDCSTRLERIRRPTDALSYQLVGYESDIAGLYARAALLLGRSGAVTVAELASAGVPSILVPLPGAPGDHQGANARALVAAGAAILEPDADCTPDAVAAIVDGLLADPVRLAAMGAAARTLARPDAADRLADLVEEMADVA